MQRGTDEAEKYQRAGAEPSLDYLAVAPLPEYRSAMYLPGEVPSVLRNIVTKLGTLS